MKLFSIVIIVYILLQQFIINKQRRKIMSQVSEKLIAARKAYQAEVLLDQQALSKLPENIESVVNSEADLINLETAKLAAARLALTGPTEPAPSPTGDGNSVS